MQVTLRITIGPNSRYVQVVELPSGTPDEALYAYVDDHRSNNLVDAHTIAGAISDTMDRHHIDELWRVTDVEVVND